jgi:YbgC/YbaW family acyl-CoA thioester hydrolase
MYKTILTVRGNELDSYGHVNNGVYLNYFEQGRWEAFRDAGALDAITNSGLLLVVTETRIRYIRESFLLDQLEVQTSFSRTSPFLVFTQRILNHVTGLPVARAKTKTIFLNEAREPHDIPVFLCEILKI